MVLDTGMPDDGRGRAAAARGGWACVRGPRGGVAGRDTESGTIASSMVLEVASVVSKTADVGLGAASVGEAAESVLGETGVVRDATRVEPRATDVVREAADRVADD